MNEKNDEVAVEISPKERYTALEQRLRQVEAVVDALVVQARDMTAHRHDASDGSVLVPPKTL